MAFADAIRTAIFSPETTADLLEDLLVGYDQTGNTSLRSTSSTSFATLSSAQVSVTPESGDIVVVDAWVKFSHSVADGGIVLNCLRNSTTDILTEGPIQTEPGTATNGNGGSANYRVIDTGQTGATTYDIRYADASASGAVYVSYSLITAIVLRNT